MTSRTVSALDAAVAALRGGRGVVVADDQSRENEGDVILAASCVTEEQIAFLMTHCRGLICAPMAGEVADRLGLTMMVAQSTDPLRTAFTVSVDARIGITTGISAADRALTARLLADERTVADDLVSPGHLFPLRADPGGLRSRRGHTEAAVELVQRAGLAPVAIICEIAGADGAMLRGEELVEFAGRHGLPLLTIGDMTGS